jgi:hypothetical protein
MRAPSEADPTDNRFYHGVRVPDNLYAQKIAAVWNLISFHKSRIPDGFFLWENMQPKEKSGEAKFHDKGRYAVRVFHQQEWKCVTVDDRIPVDDKGFPLVPFSRHNREVWPLVAAKVVLKLFPGSELPSDGAQLFYTFCGWIPEPSRAALAKAEDPQGWFGQLKGCLAPNNAPFVSVFAQVNGLFPLSSCWPVPPQQVCSPLLEPYFAPSTGAVDEAKPTEDAPPSSRKSAGKDVPKKAGGAPNAARLPLFADTLSPSSFNFAHTPLLIQAVAPLPDYPPHLTPPAAGAASSSASAGDKGDKGDKGEKGDKKGGKDGDKGGDKKGDKTSAPPAADKPKLTKAEKKKLAEESRQAELAQLRLQAEAAERLSLELERWGKEKKEREALGDVVQVVELLTGQTRVVLLSALAAVLDAVTLLHEGARFPCIAHEADTWRDQKQAYAPGPFVAISVPPCAAAVKVLLQVEAVDPLASAERVEAFLTRQAAARGVLRPATPQHSSESPKSSSRQGAPTPPLSGRPALAGRPASREAGAKPASASASASALSGLAEVALEGSFSVSIERFDWHTYGKTPVLARQSPCRSQTLTLVVPPSESASVYRMVVASPLGFYVTAYAESPLLLEHGQTGAGKVWSTLAQPLHTQTLEGNYPSQLANTSFVLLKYIFNVPEPAAALGSSTIGSVSGALASPKGEAEAAAGEQSLPPGAAGGASPEPVTLVSAVLHLLDESLSPHVMLEWVNNDSHESFRTPLLDTPPAKLARNENGYTLVVWGYSPGKPVMACKWAMRLYASGELEELRPEAATLATDFADVYAPNHQLVVFRAVVSLAASQSITALVAVNSPAAGLVVRAYDVDELQATALTADPLVTKCGRAAVNLASLFLPTKEMRVLIDCRLDPLAQGAAGEKEEIKWTLRVLSSSAPTVMVDKSAEEEFAAIKQAWEKAAPGRAKKAKATRDRFLEEKKTDDSLKRQPIVSMPGLGMNEVLFTDEERARRQEERKARDAHTERHRALMLQRREQEMGRNAADGEAREQVAREWRERFEREEQEDTAARAAYREKMLRHEALMDALRALIGVSPPPLDADEKAKGAKKPPAPAAAAAAGQGQAGASEAHPWAGLTGDIERAVDELAAVPLWKSRALLADARARLVAVVDEACSASAGVVASAPEGAPDRERHLNLLRQALSLGRALRNQSPELQRAMADKEQVLLAYFVAELGRTLALPEGERDLEHVDLANSFLTQARACSEVAVAQVAAQLAAFQEDLVRFTADVQADDAEGRTKTKLAIKAGKKPPASSVKK